MLKQTALDIWRSESQNPNIFTMCKALDILLSNGIPCGVITEFCGAPGSGKTHMCYQLCVNVQIPKALGGVGGKAVFIDTNQGFNPKRLKDIGHETSILIQSVQHQVKVDISVDTILDNITYTYCNKYTDLIAAINILKIKLRIDREIKLLVIDSFSFLFRAFENTLARTRIIYKLLTDLQVLAHELDIFIVITNELTTKFTTVGDSLCPALGQSMGHKIGHRIILVKYENKYQNQYVACLQKTFTAPRKDVPFIITKCGIRGRHKGDTSNSMSNAS